MLLHTTENNVSVKLNQEKLQLFVQRKDNGADNAKVLYSMVSECSEERFQLSTVCWKRTTDGRNFLTQIRERITLDATTKALEIQSEEDRSNASVMMSNILILLRSRLMKLSTKIEKRLDQKRKDWGHFHFKEEEGREQKA